MKHLLPTIAALLLALGAVEGLAYWWMHPKPAGQGEPVLVYRPGIGDSGSKIGDEKAPPTSASPNQQSTIINHQSSISSPSTITPLPDVVARALPSLRCTTGTATRIDRDDGVTIHTAFFEWDLSSSANTLEAFKHIPDVCLGSIGMTLIERCPPRSYQVDGETISFDHTIFRDTGGVTVHAFKGVWVSGVNQLIGPGIRTSAEQTRLIRFKAALNRFRPAHARVAQGAVRGIANPDLAWKAFDEAMLSDLTF